MSERLGHSRITVLDALPYFTTEKLREIFKDSYELDLTLELYLKLEEHVTCRLVEFKEKYCPLLLSRKQFIEWIALYPQTKLISLASKLSDNPKIQLTKDQIALFKEEALLTEEQFDWVVNNIS